MTITLYEHPLSPYAQKNKIALYEKGIAFDLKMPTGIGSGHADKEFANANPRAEVPVMIDDGFAIFDSTIILEYLEEKFPTPALLPRDPKARAQARMIEEAMDTHYEAINWGMGELRWFKRAEGAAAQAIEARAVGQARGYFAWLERQLGDKQWFNGETFGWADLSVVPYLNTSRGFGIQPEATSKLGQWHVRANARPSVQKTREAAADAIKVMAQVSEFVKSGMFKREYRDHRLEWMIRSGGLDVVLEGIKNDTIRFSHEFS